LVVELAPMEIR
nr:RecName: Full=Unknown protein 1 [Capsicum annuum var. annuum]